MNNVHQDEPVVFQSRWALSYLGGPLARDKIQKLMAERKASMPTHSASAGASAVGTGAPGADPAAPAVAISASQSRPALPPGIVQFFLAPSGKLAAGSQLLYRPALLGSARMHFNQASAKVDVWQTPDLLLAVDGEGDKFVWDDAATLAKSPDLEKEPGAGGTFGSLPAALARPKTYNELEGALKDTLYRTGRLKVWKCKTLGQISAASETEEAFRARLADEARKQCDEQIAKLKTKHDAAVAALAENGARPSKPSKNSAPSSTSRSGKRSFASSRPCCWLWAAAK